MPLLRVEHAKSSRSRCVLKECSKFILKGELRIGTAVMMPGVDEPSFKWRHLCCFTARQAKNAGSVDSVDGYDDLSEAAQALVRRTLKGELVGQNSMIGQGASEAEIGGAGESPKKKKAKAAVPPPPMMTGAALGGGGGVVGGFVIPGWGVAAPTSVPTVATTITAATAKPPSKRPREETVVKSMLVEEEGTWELDEELESVTAGVIESRPLCPYGAECFRKNPSHFVEYRHPHLCDGVGAGEKEMRISVTLREKKNTNVTVTAAPVHTAAAVVLTCSSPVPEVSLIPAQSPLPAPAPADGGAGGVCPFGVLCFRRQDPKHAAEMRH